MQPGVGIPSDGSQSVSQYKGRIVREVLLLLRDFFYKKTAFYNILHKVVTPDVFAGAVHCRATNETLTLAIMEAAVNSNLSGPISLDLISSALSQGKLLVTLRLLELCHDTLLPSVFLMKFELKACLKSYDLDKVNRLLYPEECDSLMHLALLFGNVTVVLRILQNCVVSGVFTTRGLLSFAVLQAGDSFGALLPAFRPVHSFGVEEPNNWWGSQTNLTPLHWAMLLPGRGQHVTQLLAELGCNNHAIIETTHGVLDVSERRWTDAAQYEIFAKGKPGHRGVVESVHPVALTVGFFSKRTPPLSPGERVLNLTSVLGINEKDSRGGSLKLDVGSVLYSIECIFRRQLWQSGLVKKALHMLFSVLPPGGLVALHHAFPTSSQCFLNETKNKVACGKTSTYVLLVLEEFADCVDVNALNEDGMAPIHIAVVLSLSLVVDTLLSQKNIQVHKRATSPLLAGNLLHLAAQHSTTETLRVMLRHPSIMSVALEREMATFHTPLHYLCQRADHDAILLYLTRFKSVQEKKKSVSLVTYDEVTPVHLYLQKVLQKVRSGDVVEISRVDETTKELIEFELFLERTALATTDLVSQGEQQKRAVIMDKRLLETLTHLLTKKNGNGNTILHLACQIGCSRFLAYISAYGRGGGTEDATAGQRLLYNVLKTCRNEHGGTLYHSTAETRSVEGEQVVQILFAAEQVVCVQPAKPEHGAASIYFIRLENHEGDAPLCHALKKNRLVPGTVVAELLKRTPDLIHNAICAGPVVALALPSLIQLLQVDSVKRFLEVQSGGLCALHHFAQQSDVASLKATFAKMPESSIEHSIVSLVTPGGDNIINILLQAKPNNEAYAVHLFSNLTVEARRKCLSIKTRTSLSGVLHTAARRRYNNFIQTVLSGGETLYNHAIYPDAEGVTPYVVALHELDVKLVCTDTIWALFQAELSSTSLAAMLGETDANGYNLVLKAGLCADSTRFQEILDSDLFGGAGVNISSSSDFFGNTLLHICCLSEKDAATKIASLYSRTAHKCDAMVGTRNDDGLNALHILLARNDSTAVTTLLQHSSVIFEEADARFALFYEQKRPPTGFRFLPPSTPNVGHKEAILKALLHRITTDSRTAFETGTIIVELIQNCSAELCQWFYNLHRNSFTSNAQECETALIYVKENVARFGGALYDVVSFLFTRCAVLLGAQTVLLHLLDEFVEVCIGSSEAAAVAATHGAAVSPHHATPHFTAANFISVVWSAPSILQNVQLEVTFRFLSLVLLEKMDPIARNNSVIDEVFTSFNSASAIHKIVYIDTTLETLGSGYIETLLLGTAANSSAVLPALFYFNFCDAIVARIGLSRIREYSSVLPLRELALQEGGGDAQLRAVLRDDQKGFFEIFDSGRRRHDRGLLTKLLDFRPLASEALITRLREHNMLDFKNTNGDSLLHLVAMGDTPDSLQYFTKTELFDAFHTNKHGLSPYDYTKSADTMSALYSFTGNPPLYSMEDCEYVICVSESFKPTLWENPVACIVGKVLKASGLAGLAKSSHAFGQRTSKKTALLKLQTLLLRNRVLIYKYPAGDETTPDPSDPSFAFEAGMAGGGFPEMWGLHLTKQKALELVEENGAETGGYGEANEGSDDEMSDSEAGVTTDELERAKLRRLQKIRMLRTLLNPFKSTIELVELQDDEKIASVFPIYQHNDEEAKQILHNLSGWYPFSYFSLWIGFGSMQHCAPFNEKMVELKKYCGESVAFYFAWLSCYEVCLTALAPISAGFFAVQVVDGFSSPLLALYVVLTWIWGILFVKHWERRETDLGVMWKVFSRPRADCPRPTFRPQVDESRLRAANEEPIYLSEPNVFNPSIKDPFYSPSRRRVKYLISCFFVLVFIVVSVVEFFGFITLRKYVISLNNTDDAIVVNDVSRTMTATLIVEDLEAVRSEQAGDVVLLAAVSAAHSAALMILISVYTVMSDMMTEFENHKYPRDFSRSLIFKYMALHLLNAFIPPLYIIYEDTNSLGAEDGFQNASLHISVKLITEIFIGLVLEYGCPSVLKKLKKSKLTKISPTFPKVWPSILRYSRDRVGESYATDDLKELYGEFSEITVQFAFVVAFSAICPLAVLISVISTFIELKGDLFKVLKIGRRVLPHRSHGIGAWAFLYKALVAISVTTNVYCLLKNPKVKSEVVELFANNYTDVEVFLLVHGLFYVVYWVVC